MCKASETRIRNQPAGVAAKEPPEPADVADKALSTPAPPATTLVAPAMGSTPVTITYADAKADSSELSLEGLNIDGPGPWENRVRESADADGECFVTVGPMPAEELAAMLVRIEQVAATVSCDCTVVHTHDKLDKDGSAARTAFLIVRKLPAQGHHLDLRVAVVGNVDAGKSTLVGVRAAGSSAPEPDRPAAAAPDLRLSLSPLGAAPTRKGQLRPWCAPRPRLPLMPVQCRGGGGAPWQVLTGPTSFLDDGRGLARSRALRQPRGLDGSYHTISASTDCDSASQRLILLRRRS